MLPSHCIAFAGTELLAKGELVDVVRAVKAALDQGTERSVALLDDQLVFSTLKRGLA